MGKRGGDKVLVVEIFHFFVLILRLEMSWVKVMGRRLRGKHKNCICLKAQEPATAPTLLRHEPKVCI